MKGISRWMVLPAFCLPILACGTLEVGIEQSATPTVQRPLALATTAPLGPTETPTPIPASPTAVATVTAVVTPTLFPMTSPERITFAPGGTSYTFAVNLNRGIAKTYVLAILAQQQMTVAENSNATITVLDAHDKPLVPTSSQPGQWVGTMPQSGDYRLAFLGEGPVTVTITIPPLGTAPAQ